ncbi:MAG: relaxase/mobilization nuclease domain-containing protein [Acidobacteriota bacterium]
MIPFLGGRQKANGRRDGMGRGFAGCIRYLMEGPRDSKVDPSERVDWAETRNLPSTKVEHAAYIMHACADFNPRVERPVYHFGISSHPDEPLTNDQWHEVAERLLTKLGLEDHQAVLVMHKDRDHQHLHIVVNRVDIDGVTWEPRFDVLKLQEEARAIEQDFGLELRPTLRDLMKDREPPQPAEATKVVTRADLTRQLWPHLEAATDWSDLDRRLAPLGCHVEPAKRGGGVNLHRGDEVIPMTKLHRTWSGPRLARRFEQPLREHRREHPTPTVALPEPVTPEERLDEIERRRPTFTEDDLKTTPEKAQAVVERSVPVAHHQKPGRKTTYTSEASLDRERRLLDVAGDLFAEPRKQLKALPKQAGNRRLTLIRIREQQRDTIAQRMRLLPKHAVHLAPSRATEERLRAVGRHARQLDADPPPAPGSIVVVHDAHRLSTPQLLPIVENAQRFDQRLILIGETTEKTRDRSTPFRGLLREYGGLEFGQLAPRFGGWSAVQARDDAHQGRIDSAVLRLEDVDQLVRLESRSDLTPVVEAWTRPRGKKPLVLTPDVATAKALNAQLRPIAHGEGRPLPKDPVEGDRIVFRYGLRVRDDRSVPRSIPEGTLATVERVDAKTYTLRLDNEAAVQLDRSLRRGLDFGWAVPIARHREDPFQYRVLSIIEPFHRDAHRHFQAEDIQGFIAESDLRDLRDGVRRPHAGRAFVHDHLVASDRPPEKVDLPQLKRDVERYAKLPVTTPESEALAAELTRVVRHLDLRSLEAHGFTAEQRRTLRRLQDVERRHLRPLTLAIDRLDRALRAGTKTQIEQLAKRVESLYADFKKPTSRSSGYLKRVLTRRQLHRAIHLRQKVRSMILGEIEQEMQRGGPEL